MDAVNSSTDTLMPTGLPQATSVASSHWNTVLTYHAPFIEYTLEEWCTKISESASLRPAEITKIDRYYQEGSIRHRFLVFQLRRKNKANDIFLRLDRRVEAGISAFRFLRRSGITPANDSVCT